MALVSFRTACLLFAVLAGVEARSLARADDSVESLIAALKSPTGPEAYKAVASLHELGQAAAEAVPALIEALRDNRSVTEFLVPINPTVGEAAGFALAVIGQPSVGPLIETLSDQDVGVRLNAINALANIGKAAAEAEPTLRRLASTDKDDLVRINALSAVPRISAKPPEKVVEFLRKWLSDDDPETQALVVDWLGEYRVAAQSAVPQLITALDDDAVHWVHIADMGCQEPLRCNVAEALGRIGPVAKQALPRLRRMMREDQDESARVAAAGAIARIDTADTESINFLISELESFPQRIIPVGDVLEELAELSDRSHGAVDKVQALTRDESPWLRMDALPTLRALIGVKAIPDLVHALGDEDESVRGTAAEQLGELGPFASSAVRDMLPLLQSEDDILYGRGVAVKALVKIGEPKDVIVPALCDALDGPVYWADDLFTIVDALKQLGASDQAAEKLQELIANPTEGFPHEAAAKSLQKLNRDLQP